ncbi:hypothetical protein BDN70DRAFT_891955 [Pholiota conissans]|uniref:DUF6534 domain-containing protein n=1 Tax=Pholiota conissans TaxID=109636 RepID=A0A9P5Z967_9AGAR|nr:hypothetical protein BDN70DRAFT_891955 [Pholiota conissans]
MSPTDPNLDKINVATIVGPAFLVVIINWGLFGLLSMQVYVYSQAFPKDRPALKSLVYVIYLLEMAQTILLVERAWETLVKEYGNVEGLDEVGTSNISICFIGGLVGLVVQLFYAYRISILSGRKVIPGIISVIAFISFAGALAVLATTQRQRKFSKFLDGEEAWGLALISLWGGTSALCDITITLCGTFSKTQDIVSRIVRMTIETGALTASVSVLPLILYYPPSLRKYPYFEVPLAAQAELYAITMLAVLNSRLRIRMGTEPTTWRDNELVFAKTQPIEAVELNVSSKAQILSGDIFGSKEWNNTESPKKETESIPDDGMQGHV